jgi:hypothetical protein
MSLIKTSQSPLSPGLTKLTTQIIRSFSLTPGRVSKDYSRRKPSHNLRKYTKFQCKHSRNTQTARSERGSNRGHRQYQAYNNHTTKISNLRLLVKSLLL